MGRDAKIIDTVNNCLKLKIGVFVKYLKIENIKGECIIQWKNGCKIKVAIISKTNCQKLELSYTKTLNDVEHDLFYSINIRAIPSNLGKGAVYYFICPLTGLNCRNLYLSRNSLKFRCFQSYEPRLYYPCQLSSRLNKHNDTYWRIDEKIEGLDSPYSKLTYRGKHTKKADRIARLEEKKQFHEKMRWIVIPKVLQKRGGI